MAHFHLAGKVFFVTGGAAGIGRSIAEAVLSKKAKVFFIDNNREAGEKTLSELKLKFGDENVEFCLCDVSDRSRFEEVFGQAVSKFGQVDVMFNNAGLIREVKPDLTIRVNLLGVIYGTEIAAAHMRKDKGGKGGRIINVSSLAGLHDFGDMPTYCATKHGVRSYTISLSENSGIKETGIEYATLHPSSIWTGIYQNMKDGDMFRWQRHRDQVMKYHVMPMERIVQAFLYLVTMERMNGVLLQVTKNDLSFVKMKKQVVGKIPTKSLL